MPKVAKGRRKRAYRPKTRTGCLTCRIRRVKCDEKRPACLKCTSTHRVCDGYSNVQTMYSMGSKIAPILTGPCVDIHPSSQSKRAFTFFVRQTYLQLAGFFQSDFWERLVLQAAHHESAIYYAITAIGSLHELFEHNTTVSDAGKTFALEQYNLAIRHLLGPLSQRGQRGVDVCLISCILFACFEIMQGHHSSAGSHIRSGAKLIRETVCDRKKRIVQHQELGSKYYVDCYASLEVIARVFAGLDSQVRMIVGPEKFKTPESSFSEITFDDIILSFSSIEEAKNMFEYGCCLFTRNHSAQQSCDSATIPVLHESHTNHFETLFSKFSLGLQSFIESNRPSFTPKEDIAISVLQLHVASAYVSLYVEHLHGNSQSQVDILTPHFKEMVVLAEKVISSTSPGDPHGKQTTSFCLDMGVVIPLYTIASQCQDRIIRRKAISLLRSNPRQEGLWNSLLVAKAAERIIEIQEMGLGACTDGMNLTTLSSIQPELELDGRGGRLKYIQQGQEANTQIDVVEEIFSW